METPLDLTQVGVGDPPKPPLVIGPFARAVSTVAHGLGGAVAVAAVPDGSLVVGVKSQLLRLGPSPDRTVEPFASLAATRALATGTDGAVYAVRGNAIYVVAATAPHTTKVLAGEENQGGFADAVGTAARFDFPMGISFDTHNGVLLVADTHNSAIRAVDPVSGETSTLAVNFGVTYPTGVVRADDGRLFVSAVASGELVTVTPGATRVLTRMLPHSSDGAGDVAGLGLQGGLLWDGTQLYAADPAAAADAHQLGRRSGAIRPGRVVLPARLRPAEHLRNENVSGERGVPLPALRPAGPGYRLRIR